jgi:hypothetical protein
MQRQQHGLMQHHRLVEIVIAYKHEAEGRLQEADCRKQIAVRLHCGLCS